MAKFLRIGVHHSNVSGYTSKAWSVRRVGSRVVLEMGRRRGPWSGPPQKDLLGGCTPAENCSLWHGEARKRLREKRNFTASGPSI